MRQSGACLEVFTSNQPPREVPIDRTPFAIGSDPAADLPLPGEALAPIHARIVLMGGVHHVLPAAPDIPVLCEGRPVPEGGIALTHGARIQAGPGPVPLLRYLQGPAPGPAIPSGTVGGGERLIVLMEIARTITASLALDEVLERVLEGAVRFSGAERGYLFLREGERLMPWIRGGEDPARIEVSRSIAEEVARTGRPIHRDVAADDSGRPVSESIVRLRLQAVLCLPLSVRGEVIGVVYLDTRRHPPQQRPDLPLLEALAGLAAVAIQNSRLVEERVRTERTLVMGQMARVIVHDLRSPLAAVRGLAEMLCERSARDAPARPHLETIIAEVDRLTHLTGDLLQFSKEAPPLQRRPARLADLVRKTLTPLQARLRQAGVELALELDDRAVAFVDPQRIIRVLHNLIANALEAMPSGGILTLKCGADGMAGTLEVGDSGEGIPREIVRRVFEPFFTHGKTGGTGLGLAIVSRIVEEHGGCVRIESVPARGTRVMLRLPAQEPPSDPGPAGPVSPAN